jgi:hypothetical protein
MTGPLFSFTNKNRGYLMSDVTSIKSLLVPTKSTVLDVPGFTGFKVTVNFLTRDALANIRKKANTVNFSPRTRSTTESLNEELFIELYTKATIKGWEGLTYSHLANLAPVELPDGFDVEKEIPFSEENAINLMKSSSYFEGIITDAVTDLGVFTKNSKQKSEN